MTSSLKTYRWPISPPKCAQYCQSQRDTNQTTAAPPHAHSTAKIRKTRACERGERLEPLFSVFRDYNIYTTLLEINQTVIKNYHMTKQCHSSGCVRTYVHTALVQGPTYPATSQLANAVNRTIEHHLAEGIKCWFILKRSGHKRPCIL